MMEWLKILKYAKSTEADSNRYASLLQHRQPANHRALSKSQKGTKATLRALGNMAWIAVDPRCGWPLVLRFDDVAGDRFSVSLGFDVDSSVEDKE
jgi:hypothetical protein